MPVDCKKCRATLPKPVAGISTCPRGDEEIYSWFLCPLCDLWTVERYLDVFMGDDFVTTEGPYVRGVGDAAVAKIRKCQTPHDKMCDCDVHRTW